MISWLLALAAGLTLAVLSYGRPRRGPLGLASGLRALAATLITALALNAPTGAVRRAAPWVALDVSSSWRSTGTEAAWLQARALTDSAMHAGADSLLLFGDSLRGDRAPSDPPDRSSSVAQLVDAARARGRPVLVITDGRLDDPERLADLPEGSSLIVVSLPATRDAGLADLSAPDAVVGGDTVEVRALVRAGGVGSDATQLRFTFATRNLGQVAVPALETFGEHEARAQLVIPGGDGRAELRAVLDAGDAVAANDTASISIDVSGSAAAVLVSTAPDQDARFALAVLRGTRRGAIRGYWRVAPGEWRTADGLRPVSESVVRRAIAEAALVVLHGDTAYFGAPLARTRGALVLLAGPEVGREAGTEARDEFYAASAGDSPLRASLAELPWDSLPPLRVSATPAGAGLSALVTRQARRAEERAALILRDGPRRVALVPASGFWRWRTRGGRAADAFDALWGSVFDWVGAVRRAEDPAGGAAGVSADRGARIAREWVPRAPSVASGAVGNGVAMDRTPRSRDHWWFALLAVAALSVEWILRRRIGWR